VNLPPRFRSFFARQDGTTTLEFVVVFMGFVAILFFVMEVTLYLFFMQTLEKAAEAGVRVAVTSPPAVTGIPSTIQPAFGANYGDSCTQGNGGGPCRPFWPSPASCTGADCANSFDRILNHMRGFNGQIHPENVTITYTDVGIGFAGGPTVPMVTVTVHDVPFQTGILALLLGDGDGGAGLLAQLPSRSASMTGEDLAR